MGADEPLARFPVEPPGRRRRRLRGHRRRRLDRRPREGRPHGVEFERDQRQGSFLNKSQRDLEVNKQNLLDCFTALGLPPEKRWHVIPVGPETGQTQHNGVRDLIIREFSRPDALPLFEGAPAEGFHRYMATLSAMRRAMADGTAAPDDIARFEAESAERAAQQDRRLHHFADRIIAHKSEDILFSSQFPQLFRLCEILREKGIRDGDITGNNALTSGGGLKGTNLPADYQEQIYRLLNIVPERFLHYYSMQELNNRMFKCPEEGRYHVPDEIVLFVLTKDGSALAEPEAPSSKDARLRRYHRRRPVGRNDLRRPDHRRPRNVPVRPARRDRAAEHRPLLRPR